MLTCSLFYLAVLTVHKLEKTLSLCLGVVLVGVILLAVALFRYVLPQSLVDDISELATRAMGFMGGGTVNYLFPLLTLFLLTAVFSLGAYRIIRRTEVK